MIGFRVISSFIQVVISQDELQLLGRVEKWFTLRLRFPILVIKSALKVDYQVEATELIIELKPKVLER